MDLTVVTAMHIQSLNGPLPQDPGKPAGRRPAPAAGPAQDAESFAGPNTSRLLRDLGGMDGSRADLVQRVRDGIRDGTYPDEERIRSVAERLSALL